jgi:hypothetical protein
MASRSNATKDEGVSLASMFTRDAAGWMRICSDSKARPLGPAITVSPSMTIGTGNAFASAVSSSGK